MKLNIFFVRENVFSMCCLLKRRETIWKWETIPVMENCNYNQVSAIEFNFCSLLSKTYIDFFGSLHQLRKSFFSKLMPIFFSPYPDLCQMLSRCQALLSFLTENLSWIIRNINHTLTNIIHYLSLFIMKVMPNNLCWAK